MKERMMHMDREDIIEDQVSFRYYIEHNHDFVENAKNYGCIHNGVKYGADMTAVEMSILNIHQNNMQVIANKRFQNGTLNFKSMLTGFVQYCASIEEYFERMVQYKTDRQFKVYTEKEYYKEKEYLENHTNSSKSDIFRDMTFKRKNESYHMSVNVNICRQMDYCCEIVPENEIDNWFFQLKLFPVYEDKNDKKYISRSKKISTLSDEELLKRYEKNKNNKTSRQKGTKSSPYKRSEVVSELAKRRARGICELPNASGDYHKAPFDVDGMPYLESHHVEWLSHGGEDVLENVVALCPNCHKKIHILNKTVDNQKLLSRLQLYAKKLNETNKKDTE